MPRVGRAGGLNIYLAVAKTEACRRSWKMDAIKINGRGIGKTSFRERWTKLPKAEDRPSRIVIQSVRAGRVRLASVSQRRKTASAEINTVLVEEINPP